MGDERTETAAGSAPGERWAEFGVDPDDVAGWEALSFGPFEAALAHGDGYTPGFATHYTPALRKTADSWSRAGLDTTEGLGWHRAGFTIKEALHWRELAVDVTAAWEARTRGAPVAATGRG